MDDKERREVVREGGAGRVCGGGVCGGGVCGRSEENECGQRDNDVQRRHRWRARAVLGTQVPAPCTLLLAAGSSQSQCQRVGSDHLAPWRSEANFGMLRCHWAVGMKGVGLETYC